MKYHHGDAISIIQTDDPTASANKSQEEKKPQTFREPKPLPHRDAERERAPKPRIILDAQKWWYLQFFPDGLPITCNSASLC